MPDDVTKTWTRVVYAALGFGKKHGHWPTRLVLPDTVHDALRSSFPPEDWSRLTESIRVESGAPRVRAEDDDGEVYTVGESLATRLTFDPPDPEPAWLGLRPLHTGDEEVSDLRRALQRLGHDPGDPDDPDLEEGEFQSRLPKAIETAVMGVGTGAIRRSRASEPPERPGVVSADLVALLRVRDVRSQLTGAAFGRVFLAVLRVQAVEFDEYFRRAPTDEESDDAARGLAERLMDALKLRPLPLDELKSIAGAAHAHTFADPAVGSSFVELIDLITALAVQETFLEG